MVIPLKACAANAIQPGLGVNLMPNLVTSKYLYYVNDIGFDYVRTGLPWSSVERKKGCYEWQEYDNLINLLQQHNIKPMIIIGFNNPLYGAREDFTGVSTDEQRRAFIKFSVALVQRYKDRGIVWEIWNEPNIGEFWKLAPNPDNYSLMTKYTLKEIRKVAPKEVIITGGLAKPNSGEFINNFVKTGIINDVDAIGMHFYKSDGNTVVIPEWLNIQQINKNITETVKSKRTDKTAIPVVVSELGYSTKWTNDSEYTQGVYIQRELIINKANNIPISIIHTLMNFSYDRNGEEANFGLINADFSPRQSYSMVKEVVQELKDADFVKIYPLKNSADYAFEFKKAGKKIVFAWTVEDKHTVQIYGTDIDLSGAVQEIKW